MKKLLKQLLKGQQELRQDITDLKEDVAMIHKDIADLKENAANIIVDQQEFTDLSIKVSSIEQEMGTRTQQAEHTELFKTILHNQETGNAHLDALALSSSTRDYVRRVERKVDEINTRLFNHAAEINCLKNEAGDAS